MEYSTDLFDEDDDSADDEPLSTVATEIVAHPEMPIARLPLLSEAERAQQLSEWNETAVEYPRQLTIAAVVRSAGRSNAGGSGRWFLKQANKLWRVERARNQLAHYLRELGVGLRA